MRFFVQCISSAYSRKNSHTFNIEEFVPGGSLHWCQGSKEKDTHILCDPQFLMQKNNEHKMPPEPSHAWKWGMLAPFFSPCKNHRPERSPRVSHVFSIFAKYNCDLLTGSSSLPSSCFVLFQGTNGTDKHNSRKKIASTQFLVFKMHPHAGLLLHHS